MSGNDRIAKNTIFLYFRMLCTIVVSLYTSRIILQTLGVNDYGIYQTVGGVAGLLSYIINGSLASGSSRFITFEMGRRDKGKLSDTFSSLLTVHLLFGVVVALLAETIGLSIFRCCIYISFIYINVYCRYYAGAIYRCDYWT